MQIHIKKETLILWIISLIFMTICIIELKYLWFSDTIIMGKWSAPTFYLSVVSFVINIVFLHRYGVKIVEFPAVMTLLTYLFMFGRVWLNFWGQDKNIYWVLHKLYDDIEMQRVGVLAVCCTHALFIGMISVYKRQITNISKTEKKSYELNKSLLYSLGLIMLIIGIPCRIITDMQNVISTSLTGSFTSITATTGIIDDLAFLYVPGLICVMESRPNLRKPLFIAIFGYFIIIMAITGDRRYYVSAIITFGAYIIQKESLLGENKNICKLFFIGIIIAIFLNFLEVIRKIRMENLTSFWLFLKKHGTDVFVLDDMLYEILSEFGISFYSVVSIVNCIPKVFPYQYGMTLLKTIPSCIPIGFIVGNIFSEASPSTYVNPYLGKPVGATMFGDLYANFSVYCIFFVFIVGLFLGNLFRKENLNKDGYYCMKYYTYYYILINLVRCSIFEVFRPMVWCTFIPFCILSGLKRCNIINKLY